MKKTNNHLMIFLSVLLFGGLWGIVEATVGTFLHLPFIHRGLFLSSTTILVPMAYMIMGACYKKTGTFRSVLYMGVLASGIKAISCAIFKMDFTPVYYMLIESAAMGVAVLIVRPKNIISFAGLGTFIIANTLYLGFATFIRIDVLTATGAEILDNITKYAITMNFIAVLYTFAFGAILYGFIKLAEKREWSFDKVKKVIYHPAFASGMAAIALVLTLVLR